MQTTSTRTHTATRPAGLRRADDADDGSTDDRCADDSHGAEHAAGSKRDAE